MRKNRGFEAFSRLPYDRANFPAAAHFFTAKSTPRNRFGAGHKGSFPLSGTINIGTTDYADCAESAQGYHYRDVQPQVSQIFADNALSPVKDRHGFIYIAQFLALYQARYRAGSQSGSNTSFDPDYRPVGQRICSVSSCLSSTYPPPKKRKFFNFFS